MKLFLQIIIVCSVFSCAASAIRSQGTSSEPEVSPANARRCQRNTVNISALSAIVQYKNEKVFVIAHLGSGEVSPKLNGRRLMDILSEFDQPGPIDRSVIILAAGERVKGPARVDFYLGSKLFFVSYIPRNKDFCSLCCDRRREFYGAFTNSKPRHESAH